MILELLTVKKKKKKLEKLVVAFFFAQFLQTENHDQMNKIQLRDTLVHFVVT